MGQVGRILTVLCSLRLCVLGSRSMLLSGLQWHSLQRRTLDWDSGSLSEQFCSPGLEIFLTVRNGGNGDFPRGSVVKDPLDNTGDLDLISGSESSLEMEMTNHMQVFSWNPMAREAWRASMGSQSQSQSWLSNWAHTSGTGEEWVLVVDRSRMSQSKLQWARQPLQPWFFQPRMSAVLRLRNLNQRYHK